MLATQAVVVCRLITIMIGVTEIKIGSAPAGQCDYCCPIKHDVDIKYYLYTRQNPRRSQTLIINDKRRLKSSNFNISNPTVIYLHGFTEAASGESARTIRDVYLRRSNYNVILVDWSLLVSFPWYISAVRNTRYMGSMLADFVKFIHNNGANINNIHIIGFSLGAEASGFAGKKLKREGFLLRRITGLDPAYPGYVLTNSSGHLSQGDAKFVDIVHTNPGIFGFDNPIGDVDFYANPGTPLQPGCTPWELIEFKQLDRFFGCSHNRAWRYYAESVQNPHGFPSTLCPRWNGIYSRCQFNYDGYMGIAARKPMRGKMNFLTNSNTPYARNGP